MRGSSSASPAKRVTGSRTSATAYQGPEVTCSICSRVHPCTSRDQQGQPICATCYQRHRTGEPCARCGRSKPVNIRWPIGPVCMICYTAVLRSPAECPRCGMVQPLIARGDDGAAVCGACKPGMRSTFWPGWTNGA